MPNVRLKKQVLLQYMKEQGINRLQLSEKLKVDKSTVTRVLNGERAPGSKFIGGLLLSTNKGFDYFFTISKEE